MQFIDLKKQYGLIKPKILKRIETVLDHGIYIMGPEVQELEANLAQYAKVKHSIAVSSGTDALLVAMMALDIKPGDEVITTPFTFIATAEMIRILGATPVFVDIDPRTYNINPLQIEQAITAKTKAIMPVNLYGQCADYDLIDQLAEQYHLAVIEDAAQSFGARYKDRLSCGLGSISCTSFFPAKPLGCYGDGGACFTNDDDLADKMRKIRNHGQSMRYQHVMLGLNSRLDSIQAAILIEKLAILDREIQLRQEVAKKYNDCLKDLIDVPYVEEHNLSVYAQYTIQVDDRAEIQNALQEQGIPTVIHYSVPLHKQPVFKNELWNTKELPIAERLANRVLSLPFHPYLSDEEIDLISTSLERFILEKEVV